ncbi:MAG: long-chain fatty acid--CoA ligase [Chlorobi bacterium]|nr:long-chain fatty acid--CoA ligase [Chlorobiota bacterium]
MVGKQKLTIPALINESVEKYGERTSLVFAGGENYTYKELGDDIALVAELLIKIGVKKGDKVAILSTNMPNWGVAFFAVLSLGAVTVPVLPDFHPNEVSNIIEHSEAEVIFISQELYPKSKKFLQEYCRHIILIDDFTYIQQGSASGRKEVFQPSKQGVYKGLDNYAVEETDLASIIYTSGTTGNSKGVMLTHKNLAWTTQQCNELQEIKPHDRFLSILPLSHTLENTVGFLLPMKYGASIHYLRKPPTASVLMPALQQVKPTIMLAVPLIIEKIFRLKILPKFQGNKVIRMLYKVPAIRKKLHRIAGKKLFATFGGELQFFGIGGAKLDSTVERFLLESGFPYAIGYGLTETSPLLAGTTVNNPRIGSTGLAMPGVELRIADPDPATGDGEVQAKGQNVMRGYYKSPENTKEVFTSDGWFRTGDKGRIDKDGFLYIKGRIKTMIVGASGENIFPEEIESVINRMRFVLESLVVQKKGKLVAMIHLNLEEIEKHFRQFQSDTKHYVNEKVEEILKEIHLKVNEELNKFSRLQKVTLQPKPFKKTPTKKIKRFLYY